MQNPPPASVPPVLTRWSIVVRDWLGSDTLRALSLEAEGLYLRLCLDQWEHGAARPEESRWRSAHAHRCADWSTAWRSACALFTLTDAGLVNERVARDRERAIREISAKTEAARNTNRKRRGRPKKADSDAQRTLTERSADAHPSLTHPSASASASASLRDAPTEHLPPHPPPGGADKKRRINVEAYPIPECLDSPEFREAFVDYQRTRKGGVWHESLAETSFKRMAEWGRERSIAALKNSQGAQGLFEPQGSRPVNGKPFQHAFEKTGDAIDQVFGKLAERERTVTVETLKPKQIAP